MYPPDVTGKDVILVDFSYKRPVLEDMLTKANSITVLDHHKSAENELEELLWTEQIGGDFNMSRSGAMIAWYWYFTEKAPKLIEHVQDRDLWTFKLEGTREIQAAVFSYPYDFEVWDRLMESDLNKLRSEGVAIERKHFKDINELLEVTTKMMTIAGHEVPVANLPYTMSSDAAHILADRGYPFAGCYWDTPDARVFSLRSTEDGIDVAKIAEQYGGGGHKHASGFRMPSADKAWPAPGSSPAESELVM